MFVDTYQKFAPMLIGWLIKSPVEGKAYRIAYVAATYGGAVMIGVAKDGIITASPIECGWYTDTAVSILVKPVGFDEPVYVPFRAAVDLMMAAVG